MRGKSRSIVFVVCLISAGSCSPTPGGSGPGNEGNTAVARQAIEPGTGSPDVLINFANEPAIAVNPTNPNNIVFSVGPTLFISSDGGLTFPVVTNATVPATHGADRDSALAFDSQGRLFIGYLLPVTQAAGGGRDVFVQQINPTTGATAGPATNVTGQLGIGLGTGNSHDKPWLAVDRYPSSPHRDRLYAVWDNGAGQVQTAHADSPGTTWTGLITLSSDSDCPNLNGRTCFPWPTHVAVAANGDAYVSYRTGVIVGGAGGGNSVNFFNYVEDEHIMLFRSSDGGVSYPFSVSPATQKLTTNTGNISLLDRSDSWTLGAGQDWVMPDPGNPQRVAVVFNADPTPANDGVGFDDADAFITVSTNRGATWSAPQRLNADGAGPVQLFPTAAWDSANDCLTVAWLDGRRGFTDPAFRNSQGNVLLDTIIRTSSDGGLTFGPEFQLDDVAMDPDPGEGNFNDPGVRPAVRIGEYFGVLSRRGAVWPGGTGLLRVDNSEHSCALPSACVLGSRNVNFSDRDNITSPVTAGTFLQIGSVATLNGDGLSGGNALIRDRGVVNGNLTLRGTLAHQNIFTVNGTLTQNDSPIILTLPQRTFPVGSGTQQVPNNTITTLAPGTFGNMTFRSGSQVTLTNGTYNFASLNIEPDVRVIVQGGGVNVNVQGSLQIGDRDQVIGSGGSLFVYSNATTVRVGTDVRFNGIIDAPVAAVSVFSRTIINGCVGGQDLNFDTDVRLTAGNLRLPVGPPAP